MNINERIEKLRDLMAKRKIDAYIIPTSDPHQSEYVAEYYKTREFITGFTGSAGTAVITMKKSGLWTDGRYFVQAASQLESSEVELYKLGIDKTYEEFLEEEVPAFGKIAFDGKCFSVEEYRKLSESMNTRMLIWDVDLIGEVWEDRPKLPTGEAWVLEEKYSGQTPKEKIEILRQMMKLRELDFTFIGSLEDVCYLYNLRGSDVESTPVVISYAIISQEQALLFVDMNKISDETKLYLSRNSIKVLEYDAAYEVMEGIRGQQTVYIDPKRTNISIYQRLNSNVKIKKGVNLTSLMKAVKNEVELTNTKEAFLKDGVALVKFFNWVETGVKTGALTEYQTTTKLEDIRKGDPNFIENSFATISAYGANAAMPHYSPSVYNSPTLNQQGLFLVDSGGHYYQGTTDITRTVALGELNAQEKYHYTMCLKAHINAITAVFPKGTTGGYVDAICRNPLAKRGLDFNHGTGHGVGYLLSVHEGPFSISKRDGGIALVPGMITSIEPGIYIEGEHGIRIENIVTVVEKEKSEFGEFYGFEVLSYVPIDTKPVVKELLDKWELDWLNDYNYKTRKLLTERLYGSDLRYLDRMTEKI